MKREIKAGARAVNEILWRDWDPIGGGVPADEYQTYVGETLRILRAGGSRAELADYLRWAADEALRCPAPEARLNAVLDKLFALGLKSGAARGD